MYLPVEILAQILEVAVDSNSTYHSLSLVSCTVRDVVLEYGMQNMVILLQSPHQPTSFVDFLSAHPEVALRVRCLRLFPSVLQVLRVFDSGGSYYPLPDNDLKSLLRSCVNVTTLDLTTYVLCRIMDDPSPPILPKLKALHLNFSDPLSTRKVGKSPICRSLFRQITHFYAQSPMPAPVCWHRLTSTWENPWSFNNLMYFASTATGLPSGCPPLDLLEDREIFPELQQIVFFIKTQSTPKETRRLLRLENRYSLLQEAKRYDRLYLSFNTSLLDACWVGREDLIWNESIRLVDDCLGDDDVTAEFCEFPSFEVPLNYFCVDDVMLIPCFEGFYRLESTTGSLAFNLSGTLCATPS
jgi:hypothetical protein